MTEEFGYIYKVDMFNVNEDGSKADTIKNSLIFENAEDCHWLLQTKEWAMGLIMIEYAMISKKSELYQRAMITSKQMKDLREKEKEPVSVTEVNSSF
jgi:hypothetical protein